MATHRVRWRAPLAWGAVLAVLSVVDPRAWTASPVVALGLLIATTASAVLARPQGRNRTLRLAPAFVLTALLTLPGWAAPMIAVPAVAVAGGVGLAGPFRSRRGSSVGAVAGLLVAATLLPTTDLPGAPLALATALFAWLLLQLGAALAATIEQGFDATAWRLDVPRGSAPLLELVSIPLAWVMAEQIASTRWLHVLVASALILAAQAVSSRLAAAQGQLRHAHRNLSRRIDELDTLHAISREMLSTLETDRLFAIIDRECAKIFGHDASLIALRDRDGADLRPVYRRPPVDPSEARALDVRLQRFMLDRKQGLRLEGDDVPPGHPPLASLALDPRQRSALAVPLIVSGRVTGMLSVQSRRVGAFDDHQLSVLVTVAQQVAMAIENARHHEMATVDSLTGCCLRDYFFRRLDEEHRRASRYGGQFAVLMIDLDGFKGINDRYGHPAGDRFLARAGATIRRELRGADLACRYGGDEFCLMLPETDRAGAGAIAERIRLALRALQLQHDGVLLQSTASVGFAVFPDHDRHGDVAGLVRNADEALYRAKRGGRDRVVPFAA